MYKTCPLPCPALPCPASGSGMRRSSQQAPTVCGTRVRTSSPHQNNTPPRSPSRRRPTTQNTQRPSTTCSAVQSMHSTCPPTTLCQHARHPGRALPQAGAPALHGQVLQWVPIDACKQDCQTSHPPCVCRHTHTHKSQIGCNRAGHGTANTSPVAEPIGVGNTQMLWRKPSQNPTRGAVYKNPLCWHFAPACAELCGSKRCSNADCATAVQQQ